ncbi:MAG: DciA family protein [Vulcanimicrobiota bacterium]
MQPMSIKSVLKRTMKKLDLYEIYKNNRSITFWPRICGKQLNQVTQALKLRGKILFVGVKDHIWATELSGFKYQFLKKFNKLLGTGIVEDIRFQVNPSLFRKTEENEPVVYEFQEIELSARDEEEIENEICLIEDEKTRQMMRKFLEGKKKYEKWLKKRGGKPCPNCGAMIEKDEPLCPPCIIDRQGQDSQKLVEILNQTPWLDFRESKKQLSTLDFHLYCMVRDSLVEGLKNEVYDALKNIKARENNIDTADLKTRIITFAMMKSGMPPARMTDDNLKKILPFSFYKYYQEETY